MPLIMLPTTQAPGRIRHGILALIVGCTGALGFAQEGDRRVHRFELPLLESRHNLDHGYETLSMQQSLLVTSNVKLAIDLGTAELAGTIAGERRWLQNLLRFPTASLLQLGLDVLPLGSGWLHEEWHRDVLLADGTPSKNPFYDPERFGDTVFPVYGLRDQALIDLKARKPAAQVRLSSAGLEAEVELGKHLARQQFFYGGVSRQLGPFWIPDYFVLPTLWLNLINGFAYLTSGRSADEIDDPADSAAATDVYERDFTGHDFTAWAYDLFRPDEPYAARGPHPSGIGIDRYRVWADLRPRERRFLDLQGRLFLLNLIDPALYWIGGVAVRWDEQLLRLSGSIKHYLTPFGYALDVNALAMLGLRKMTLTLHNYCSPTRYFPGLSLAVLDQLVGPLKASVTLAGWLQPEDLRFDDDHARLGGRLLLQVGYPIWEALEVFAGLDAKTAGWVAGNVCLDPCVHSTIGLVLQL